MPKFTVVMPNPDDVNETPRREQVEAPDEHSARIVGAERFGRQVTEISEYKPRKKSARKSARKSTTARKPETARKSATNSGTQPPPPEFQPATPTKS